jgi:CubicO group peptidase (beta-lactamase class C family)
MSLRHRSAALASAATLLFLSAASAQLTVDAAAIDTVFARFDTPTVPGCALGLYLDGRIVYEHGYGSANLDHDIPIAPDTVFYVGSVSKQFTAFTVALLIEQGKLSLSDPVRKYIPALPTWAESITVDHLIHHTSGIRDYITLWEISGRSLFADEPSAAEVLDLITRQRALDFPPGTRRSYSNSGYFLLAEIVGRATGTPLSRFAQDAIFSPLDMTSTHFHDDNSRIVPRRATGYLPDGAGGFYHVAKTFAVVGGGGVFTTVRDLVKWDENFYSNKLGGGAALIEMITTPGSPPNSQARPYAFGLLPGTYRGLPTLQHGGSFPGFNAFLLRFPTEHVSIAVLCNDVNANAEGLSQRVADSYLAGRLEAPPAPPSRRASPTFPTSSVAPVEISPAELKRFVGRYELQFGQVVSIVEADGGLRIRLRGREQPMIPTSATTFAAGWPARSSSSVTERRCLCG